MAEFNRSKMRRRHLAAVLLLAALAVPAPTWSADQPPALPAAPAPKPSSPEAEKAWQDLRQSLQPPAQPKEWAEKAPTPEERDAFMKKVGEFAVSVADKAQDFHTKFAQDPHAADARQMELSLLQTAQRLGNTNVTARLAKLEADRLNDPSVSEEEKVVMRAQKIQREAMKNPDTFNAEFEKGARELLKDYPKSEIPYQMLISVAGELEGDPARKLATELSENQNAPEQVREMAKGMLKKLDAVGKPVALQFTALDGSEVDVAKLKGKVVLIDFWATWCGPCVAELPNVKKAYEKLHPKGFEIVGISFDQKKEALTGFIDKEKVTWPQYFDGKGWQNKYGQEFGINSIPAMWLLDKRGILRDQNARGALEEKVEKLLAEQP